MNILNKNQVILFDGVCNLCSGLVKFIIRHDPEKRFQFAALQSPAGQSILKSFQLPLNHYETFLLVDGDRYYQKSTAVLNLLKNLGGYWSIFYIVAIIPTPIRDWVYDRIAKRRYQWFGKKDSC